MDKQTKQILLIGGIAAAAYYVYNYVLGGSLTGGSVVPSVGYAPPQPLPTQMSPLENYGSDYNPVTGSYAGPGSTPSP